MTSQSYTKDVEKRYAELQLIALDMAKAGDTNELKKMIASGLPVNLCDSKGNSLLMLSTYYGQMETSSMLLKGGAEVDRRNDHGQTPLGGAAFKGDLAITTLLLDARASIDADNGGGKTPLMYAAMFGHRQVVEYLLARGADPNSKTFLGLSAQSLAKFTGTFRSLQSLFKR